MTVITGFGAITPVGTDRESTWRALLAGRSGITRISTFDPTGLPVQIAGAVRDFDPAAHLPPKRVARTARFSQFAVAAAREAVVDADLKITDADNARIAVVVNTGVGAMAETEDAARHLATGAPGRLSPYFVPSVIPNMAACEVAIDLGLHGLTICTAAACASGVYAFLEARRLIRAGEADVVICGGTDASITPAMIAGLSSLGAASRCNDDQIGRAHV